MVMFLQCQLIFLLHKPKDFSFLKIIEAILVPILETDSKIQTGHMIWLESHLGDSTVTGNQGWLLYSILCTRPECLPKY